MKWYEFWFFSSSKAVEQHANPGAKWLSIHNKCKLAYEFNSFDHWKHRITQHITLFNLVFGFSSTTPYNLINNEYIDEKKFCLLFLFYSTCGHDRFYYCFSKYYITFAQAHIKFRSVLDSISVSQSYAKHYGWEQRWQSVGADGRWRALPPQHIYWW